MIAFKNKKFSIKVEKIRLPNGDKIEFATVSKNPGTAIIALLNKNTIIMNRQYRPAIRKWIYEFPGGKLERGETPIQNAFKELEEECGYKASQMKLLAKIHPAPHISNDLQYVFLATKLKKTKVSLEKGEVIKAHTMKINTAIKMAKEGRITDATTIAGLLLLNFKK